MTERQERDLRDGFEKALHDLRLGAELARRENVYDSIGDSAVVVVIGQGSTYEVVHAVDNIMKCWDRNRAAV